MLSGETSIGSHPLKATDAMRNIIRDVEKKWAQYFKKHFGQTIA
jgi:pyruvate kinase